VLFLGAVQAIAQLPDTIKFEDAPRDTTCSAVASRISILLSNLTYPQTTEIAEAIQEWEKWCPQSEPLLRAKILLQLQRQQNCDELVQQFIPEYFGEFNVRVSDYVYLDVYDYDRERYGYVPFESAFDHWTEEWALQLIEGIRYGTDEFLACALFTANIERFDELLSSGDFNNTLTWQMMDETSKNRWDPLGTGSFHVGSWQPIGTLSRAFGGTAEFGVSIGAKINRTSGVRVEAVLKLRPMNNKDGLTLLVDRSLIETTSGACFTIGAQILKTIPVHTGYFVDFGGGMEYLSLSTRQLKASVAPDFEESFYAISTYNVFGRVVFRRGFTNGSSAGIYTTWNYAPFVNDRDLGRSIGDSFITFGIEYRPKGK
jgi:hypothetical protein